MPAQRAVRGQVAQLGHVVSQCERAQEGDGLGNGRLADGETRVAAAFEHDDAHSVSRENSRQGGSADAATDDGDIVDTTVVGTHTVNSLAAPVNFPAL